jgi:predicted unusual protein kinase regulating ubiquinone biosynthesis (AarF/ABC1/UbiB family)
MSLFKVIGEAASPDTMDANSFIQEFNKMIKEEGYFSKEAFNADNTSYQM